MDVQEKIEKPVSRVLYRQSSVETRLVAQPPSDNDSDDEKNKPHLRIVEEIKKTKPFVPPRISSNKNDQSSNLDQDDDIESILEKCLQESKIKAKPDSKETQ